MTPQSIEKTANWSILPPHVRGWVLAAFVGLAAIGAGLFVWRGPAILLDLAALSGGWLCF